MVDFIYLVDKSDDFETLKKSYNAICQWVTTPSSIIVVNNGNAMAEDLFKTKTDKMGRVKFNICTNIKYSDAFNLGLMLSTAPYVVIIHPDTVFVNNWVDVIVSFMQKNHKIGMVDAVGFNQFNKKAYPQNTPCFDTSKYVDSWDVKGSIASMLYGDGFCYIFRREILGLTFVTASSDTNHTIHYEIAYLSLTHGFENYGSNISISHLAKNIDVEGDNKALDKRAGIVRANLARLSNTHKNFNLFQKLMGF